MIKYSKILCYIMILCLLASCGDNTARNQDGPFTLQKESNHFVVYYSEHNADIITDITQILEEHYERISTNLQTELYQKRNVEIYSDKDSIQSALLENTGSNTLMGKKKNVRGIQLMLNDSLGGTYTGQSVLQISAANVALGMVESINNKVPYYLCMGTVAYESVLKDTVKQSIVSAIETNSFPTINQLKKANHKNLTELYPFLYILTEYIVCEYGYDKLIEFIKNPDFKDVFHSNEEEFQKRWIEYEKANYQELTLQQETNHFLLYSLTQDISAVKDISQVLEDNYNRITNHFKQQLSSKCEVFIYPNLNSFHKEFRSFINPVIETGLVGCANVKDKFSMISPNHKNSLFSYDEMLQISVHEFVHTLINTIASDMPAYINEGIATYEAEQKQNVILVIVPALRTSTFPTLQQLSKMNAEEGMYQFSYTLIQYIVEQYGYEKLIEFMKMPDVLTVFGVDESEFEANWVNFLKDRYIN